jgi:hypothetical protein
LWVNLIVSQLEAIQNACRLHVSHSVVEVNCSILSMACSRVWAVIIGLYACNSTSIALLLCKPSLI